VSFTLAGFHVTGAVIMLGLVTGMTYGILAAGLVLVYRASRIINFAYGDIGAFGAALLGVSTTKWGVPYWLAFILAITASAALSAASEVVVIRRLKGSPLVVSVIATLGLGQLVSAVSSIVDGSVGATYPQPPGFPTFSAGALLMTPAYTAMLFLSPLIVVGLTVFLRRGRLGVAMRASAANPDAAAMAGMNAGRLTTLAWAIGGAVAACTVILVLPTRGFSGGEFLGPGLLLRGLVCAVVARMVNLPVALLSGVALGVVEQLLLFNYPSGGQVEMVIFVIIIIALLLQRSQAGRSEEKGSWLNVEAFAPLPHSLRRVPSIRRLGWVVAGVAIPLGLVIPLLTTNENATTFALIAAFAIIGISLSLVTGLGGQLSLGQFAVAGVGAVASFVIADHGGSFLIGLVAAAVAGAAAAIVIGLPALRIRGLMLAVTTLGFALAAQDWLFQQSWMLGNGVSPRPLALGGFRFDTGKRYYLVAFAVLLFSIWLARNVWNSRISRQVRAVRDNEDAARAFGVHATTMKLQTFVIGGVLAGLGGAVYGHLLAQEGSSAYAVDLSIDVAAIVVIGGLGLLVGPILGSLYIIGIPQFVPLDNVGIAATSLGWLLLILSSPGGVGQLVAPYRDRLVDLLARRAGLDPGLERAVTPAAGIGASGAGLPIALARKRTVAPGESLLRAAGLTKQFGGVRAVDHVDLDVRGGEILGVIGPNGAGKTTLFELLGGFTQADEGSIHFAGRDITALAPESRAELGLIRSFQDAALFPSMTVEEVVLLALERAIPTSLARAVSGLSGRTERRKVARAEELMACLGLLSFRDTNIAALSTGTRRIAELGCLIALEPTLLLLDEPTSGIAQRETEALGDVLRTIRAALDLTMVVIEHDIPMLMSLADRVAAMESGSVIAIGRPTEVQSDPRVVASYLGGDPRAIARSEWTGAAVGGS
jgi:ABC-type branched-subunit amino acid transport system ATPase component/ABC-type branched-subunit amino acid transport system permease subunit